tara:strand:+ start:378 stop:1262 length:885 start_codon:yes stop_codon:yes gene_type:complete
MRKYIYITLLASVLIGCGGNESTEVVDEHILETVVGTQETLERVEKSQMIFRTIPSPLETATLFQEAGVEYNQSITSPIGNVSNYVTSVQKSLNLGVYGADLSFANIFGQSQESMLYMNCSKILSDGLGVINAFDVATIERMEVNMNNRDSLLGLISDAYWITDAHLKENGQDHLSVLIITGGWIEGLYIGTATLNKDEPNKALMQRIADQKYSLKSLIDLLDTYDNESVAEIGDKLKTLQTVYSKIGVKTGETTVSEREGVATIGGGNVLTFETEIIFEIRAAIKKIRDEIIL